MQTIVEPIPTDWRVVRLAEVATIILGGTPSTEVPAFWGGDIKWMSSGEVNQKHVFDVAGRITGKGLRSSNATIVNPPSVAIGLAGQGKTRGTVALVHARLCTNQSIALVQGHDGRALTRFLFHNLNARYKELRARSSGGGRGGLSRSILNDIEVPLPSFREQRRVASILDTLDEAIRKSEDIIAKLKQIRQGLLHDLLTRGVNERGEVRPRLSDASHLYKESPLGPIPSQWQVAVLGSYLDETPQNGLYKPLELYGSSGTPIVRIDGFHDGVLAPLASFKRLRLAEVDVRAYRLDQDDLLVNRVNSIDFVGKAALVPKYDEPVVFESNMMRVRVQPDRLVPAFALLYLCSPRCRRFFYGRAKSAIAQASINQTDVMDLPMTVPAIAEQSRIAACLDQFDQHAKLEVRAVEKLREIREGTATDLLTGRVRVTKFQGVAQ